MLTSLSVAFLSKRTMTPCSIFMSSSGFANYGNAAAMISRISTAFGFDGYGVYRVAPFPACPLPPAFP